MISMGGVILLRTNKSDLNGLKVTGKIIKFYLLYLKGSIPKGYKKRQPRKSCLYKNLFKHCYQVLHGFR